LSHKRIVHKVLLTVALTLFILSIVQPWLWEKEQGHLHIDPSIFIFKRLWSYQVVMEVFLGSRLAESFTLRFQEYWFFNEFEYPRNTFQGWFLIFIFQIMAAITGTISLVREKIRGKPLLLVCTLMCSFLSLILCIFQLLRQAGPRGVDYSSINFDVGFSLALISLMFWTTPLWIFKLAERKILSLILLLVATAIPTVLFIKGIVSIFEFYIEMGGADFWLSWNQQLIGARARGIGRAIHLPFFVLALMCIPLFFISLLFLYRELQIRKGKRASVQSHDLK
jgi:hypothetical protein